MAAPNLSMAWQKLKNFWAPPPLRGGRALQGSASLRSSLREDSRWRATLPIPGARALMLGFFARAIGGVAEGQSARSADRSEAEPRKARSPKATRPNNSYPTYATLIRGVRETTKFLLLAVSLGCSQLVDDGEGPFDGIVPPLLSVVDTVPPVVVQSYPASGSPMVDPASSISIEFSLPMNRDTTESGFSLTQNGQAIDGTFLWANPVMIFQPATLLNQPGVYTYTLDKSLVESEGGVNMLDDYNATFTFSSDITGPAVLSTTPGDGASGVATDATFTVVFNEPMDVSSVLADISSSPDMNFNLPSTNISGNNTVFEFVPIDPLSSGTTYTVTIPSTITDATGNTLNESSSVSFTVGSDFDGPTLTSINTASVANFVNNGFVVTGGFEKNEAFILTFDEAVQASTLLSGVTFTPSASFTVTDISGNGTQYSLQPSSDLTVYETYELNVTGAILDSSGNSLTNANTYYVRINGPLSQEIQVLQIYTNAALTVPILDNTVDTTLSCDTEALAGSLAAIGGVDRCDHKIYIAYCWGTSRTTCTAPVAGLNILQSSVQISIATEFGTSLYSQFIEYPQINVPNYVYESGIHDLTQTATYKITIKGGASGVTDNNGNTMAEDFVVRVRYP